MMTSKKSQNENSRTANVIARLMEVFGFQFARELADFLGLSHNTLSTWKARGTMDWDVIIDRCEKEGVNIHYIATGIGPHRVATTGSLHVVQMKVDPEQQITLIQSQLDDLKRELQRNR